MCLFTMGSHICRYCTTTCWLGVQGLWYEVCYLPVSMVTLQVKVATQFPSILFPHMFCKKHLGESSTAGEKFVIASLL